jgi:hypothetical protein
LSKEIAGKVFLTAQEASAAPPSEQEIAQARKLLEESQKKVDAKGMGGS